MQSNKASTTLPLYLFCFSERCRHQSSQKWCWQLKVHFAGTDAVCNLTKLFGTTSHTWPANGRPAKRVSAVECRPVDDRRLVVGKFMICCNLGAVTKASKCPLLFKLYETTKLIQTEQRCKKKHWSHSQKRSLSSLFNNRSCRSAAKKQAF